MARRQVRGSESFQPAARPAQISAFGVIADMAGLSAGSLVKRLTLCGHIEIKTERDGRDGKHCGSTTEALLSP